jgi:MYXO-CTERM domain-containing protein
MSFVQSIRARRFAVGLGAGLSAALSLHAGGALAYDRLATSCVEDPRYCQIAPIKYDRVDALPIEWAFDTGWVPANSPLQVHLWAGIYANTRVSLAGQLETTWLPALTLATPGDPGGGFIGFHYGVEIGAQAMVNIEVAGVVYTWTGDIPYIPQFDFQVEGGTTFDAWGWQPGATVASKTEPQTLVQVGIADIIGGSIPGIDGGFELDVAMELEATYVNKRIVIKTTEGEQVGGGPIMSADDTSAVDYLGGPSVELDVHPEGTVDYNGVLHLIPAFYVELLGNTWQIPIADIPISFPITETEWIFDRQRVHVPLPDLVLSKEVIDFGEIEVGQKSLVPFQVFNAGEAVLAVEMESSDPESFPLYEVEPFEVESYDTVDAAVRFIPQRAGEFKATISVASNDPSDPVQTFQLRGVAFGGDPGLPPPAGPEVSEDGGCACRAAGSKQAGGEMGAAAAIAIMALLTARRRGRRA